VQEADTLMIRPTSTTTILPSFQHMLSLLALTLPPPTQNPTRTAEVATIVAEVATIVAKKRAVVHGQSVTGHEFGVGSGDRSSG